MIICSKLVAIQPSKMTYTSVYFERAVLKVCRTIRAGWILRSNAIFLSLVNKEKHISFGKPRFINNVDAGERW